LAKERKCGTEDEFELLAAAGHDLMGAIEVEPIHQAKPYLKMFVYGTPPLARML